MSTLDNLQCHPFAATTSIERHEEQAVANRHNLLLLHIHRIQPYEESRHLLVDCITSLLINAYRSNHLRIPIGRA